MITQVDGLLFRGPRPTEADLKQFKYDVNLEVGWFEFLHGECKQEQDWCRDLGVNYIHRPMSDLLPPYIGELRTLVWDLQKFTSRPTLVHCLHGEDRTGMVVAAWRILVQGWSPEKAIDEMYSFGFHRVPYIYWVPALLDLKP